jgi:hypothetical protein
MVFWKEIFPSASRLDSLLPAIIQPTQILRGKRLDRFVVNVSTNQAAEKRVITGFPRRLVFFSDQPTTDLGWRATHTRQSWENALVLVERVFPQFIGRRRPN